MASNSLEGLIQIDKVNLNQILILTSLKFISLPDTYRDPLNHQKSNACTNFYILL